MSPDIVRRLLTWTFDPDAQPASELMDEAAGEIQRLRDRCNELIDKVRGYVAEHDPMRMDMNDPMFSEDAYE